MARVLVVDDSAAARNNLKNVLGIIGHTVVAEAVNGIQAYGEYEKNQPDLVTMDITMPKSDGLEAIEKIVNRFSDAKIIVVSTLAQKNMVLRALEAGAKHYIIKPFSPEKVSKIINLVLEEVKQCS